MSRLACHRSINYCCFSRSHFEKRYSLTIFIWPISIQRTFSPRSIFSGKILNLLITYARNSGPEWLFSIFYKLSVSKFCDILGGNLEHHFSIDNFTTKAKNGFIRKLILVLTIQNLFLMFLRPIFG